MKQRQFETLNGSVGLEVVRGGTGSQHRGAVLSTDDGEHLLLVRLGGHPFEDRETTELDGRRVEVKGYRLGNEFRYLQVSVRS